MPSATRPADRYSPLYLLAALGAGGIAVTFFLWLMFWVPHPDRPVPVFEDIVAAFGAGDWRAQAMIGTAYLGIAFFAFQHYRLLIWNLMQLSRFKRTADYAALCASNAESQLMALPLTLAMAINVGFVLGMVAVPGLWGVVEWLFPGAVVAFLAVGVLALRQLGAFLGRVKTTGGFDWTGNGSFAQMLPAFALSMVGVGLSAPAAMSSVPLISGASIILATFFLVASAVVGIVALILGVHSMMSHGVSAEAAPTILIVIPILTVLGILMLRVGHGLHVHFGVHEAPGDMLLLLTKIVSAQVLFGIFGLAMLRRTGYGVRFLSGPENSVGAYALICPGVAMGVMLQFWINIGLVGAGLVAKFGVAFWVLSALPVATQVWMVWLLLRLNRRHFARPRLGQPVAAQ